MQRRSRCTKTNNLEVKAHCCHRQSLCALARSPLSHITVCFGKKKKKKKEKIELVTRVFWRSESIFYVTADQLEKGGIDSAVYRGLYRLGPGNISSMKSKLAGGPNWSWKWTSSVFCFVFVAAVLSYFSNMDIHLNFRGDKKKIQVLVKKRYCFLHTGSYSKVMRISVSQI